MRFSRTVTYPQVKVLSGKLFVPVKRVEWTLKAGRFTCTVAFKQKPVIPQAFRDDPEPPATSNYLTLN